MFKPFARSICELHCRCDRVAFHVDVRTIPIQILTKFRLLLAHLNAAFPTASHRHARPFLPRACVGQTHGHVTPLQRFVTCTCPTTPLPFGHADVHQRVSSLRGQARRAWRGFPRRRMAMARPPSEEARESEASAFVRAMRLRFSPPRMVDAHGDIRQEYFRPTKVRGENVADVQVQAKWRRT